MTVPRKEKAHEKHAWIALFAVGIFGAANAIWWVVSGGRLFATGVQSATGMTWDQLVASDPELASLLDFLVRGPAIVGLMAYVMIAAISASSYRKGEKWAWYTLWTVPIVFGFLAVLYVPLDAILGIVALIGLLLPYRKFFPKQQGAQA